MLNENEFPEQYRIQEYQFQQLTTIFQLYRGGQCYWWGKLEYPKKTSNMLQITNTLYHINVVSSTPRHEWDKNSKR